jgi:chromosomal replication initiation ATPase DnaA
MGKAEDFSKVIKVVTELADVRKEDVLGKSRVQEIVDARWMAIYLMDEQGYCTKEIAELFNEPVRTINHAIRNFPDRAKYSNNGLGNIFYMARQQLR